MRSSILAAGRSDTDALLVETMAAILLSDCFDLNDEQTLDAGTTAQGRAAGAQSHAGQPLSNTTFQRPSASRRQIELNVPICRPPGSRTGPLLRARVPESSTSTRSGAHENGGLGPSKNGFQPA